MFKKKHHRRRKFFMFRIVSIVFFSQRGQFHLRLGVVPGTLYRNLTMFYMLFGDHFK